MALNPTPGVAVVGTGAADHDHGSYVDWAAVIAGIVLASAISLVLLTFGAAIGLNLADFEPGGDASPLFVGLLAAVWLLAVLLLSYMSGAYLTGRLRKRFHDSNEHESDVRDGAHGLLVWAGSAILGTVLTVSGLGAAANAVGSVASTATTAVSNVAGGAAEAVDPNAYFVDTLFRANQPAADDAEAARAEAGRIFAQAALGDGTLSEADSTYLANTVAANTGLTPEEAQARVSEVAANVEAARQQALEAAESARRTGVISAFLLAASLLVAAVGAFWAAQKGGDHRDKNTVFADAFRRF